VENINETVMKMAKINGQSAKKRLSKETITGCIGEVVGCVSGIEVDIDSVKVAQKFYIKHVLASDVVLGMPWVAKARCGFGWKNRKCYRTIRSGFDEAIFVISEKPTFEENIVGQDCIIKEKSSDGKNNDVVNIRCVVNALEEDKMKYEKVDAKDDNIEDASDEKKNRIVNVMNKRKSNQTERMKTMYIPDS
ncbi:32705_t:CDS:2, partial [Racocetra persica]